MASDTSKSMPFIKNLASSDRKLRTASISALQSFLSARRTSSRLLTSLECLKLWKSLFFALWMTDRPVPQQHLCVELSTLHTLLPPESVPTWWSAFWKIMGEEWTTGIDVLRMNKFLLLVRRVVGAMVVWPRERGWNGDATERVVEVLAEWPFEDGGDLRKVPTGLRLHVLDVLVDEVEGAGLLKGEKDGEEGEEMKFVRRITRLVEKLGRCPVKAVRDRASECSKDERLPWNQRGGEGDGDGDGEDPENDSWDGFDD